MVAVVFWPRDRKKIFEILAGASKAVFSLLLPLFVSKLRGKLTRRGAHIDKTIFVLSLFSPRGNTKLNQSHIFLDYPRSFSLFLLCDFNVEKMPT